MDDVSEVDGLLLRYVALPNFPKVWVLLKDCGADPFAQDAHGYSVLHGACASGSIQMVQLIMTYGARDLNITTSTGMPPIFPPCWRGDLTMMQFLVLKGADIHIQDCTGQTALHIACERGYLDIALFLLQNGAQVNPKQLEGGTQGTPLHEACTEGHVEVCKVLIVDYHADINAKDNRYGETALHWACTKGHVEVVKLLIQHGADIVANDNMYLLTPLYRACERGHYEIMKLLLIANAAAATTSDNNCNNNDYVNLQNTGGIAPIHDACDKKDGRSLEIVKLLLQYGANVNVVESPESGNTPMYKACANGYLEMAQLLYENGGADLNIPSEKTGKTPLHRQCQSLWGRNKQIIKFLLENGAAVNVHILASKQEDGGDTPLHLVCGEDPDLEIAKWLVEDYGANVNLSNNMGKTALHEACRLGNWEIIQLLMAHGADIFATENDGMTPLHWASGGNDGEEEDDNTANYLKIIQMLVDNGAHVNAQARSTGVTPLYLACESSSSTGSSLEVIQLLLSRGADLAMKTISSSSGEVGSSSTPLQAASENGHLEVVWFLVRQYPWLLVSGERLE